jgi:endonuclease YncB( thermonuclease family)
MKSKGIIVFLLVIILLALFSIYYPNLQRLTGHATSSLEDYYPSEQATLLRVVDGDTIEAKVDGYEETWKIRMLGINTPEKNMPFSNLGKEYLQSFEGKTITLRRDREDTDKYQRKLRYVFYNDEFLNLEIITRGFANSYYTKDLRYEKKFLNAEKQARIRGLGVWQKSQDVCVDCISLEELNPIEEYFIIKNSCNFDCSLEGWFAKDAGRNLFYLRPLASNAEKKYSSSKEIWNNNGDNFFIFDKNGFFVMFYGY